MSRAFTKEIDDAPPPPLPERPVSDAPNLVTPAGAQAIEAALAEIETQLAAVTEAEEVERLRRDQRYWLARKASMQVITTPEAPTEVGFGTRVTLDREGKTVSFQIVGEDEADPGAGKLSWTSPLAKALMGATPGDVVVFGPREEEIEVLAVEA